MFLTERRIPMHSTRQDLPLSTERMENAVPPIIPVGLFRIKNPKRFWITATIFFILLALLATYLIYPFFSIIDPDHLYNTPLSNNTVSNIRFQFTRKDTDYPGKFVRWNYVDPYYGTINDCIIMIALPFGTAPEEPWQIVVAGYTFEWDHPIDLFVYKESSVIAGKLCTLQVAYQRGWLTDKQIGEIHKKHLEYREEFPKLLAEWEKYREIEQNA